MYLYDLGSLDRAERLVTTMLFTQWPTWQQHMWIIFRYLQFYTLVFSYSQVLRVVSTANLTMLEISSASKSSSS